MHGIHNDDVPTIKCYFKYFVCVDKQSANKLYLNILNEHVES